MNSLLGIFAAPTALGAVGAVRQTAAAVASPFQAMLESAIGASEQAGEAALGDGSPSDGFQEMVAQRLQQLLASLGIQPGDQVTLEVDDWTGDVTVAGSHPQADAIEEALANDGELTGWIRQLGELEGRFDGSPFKSTSKLQIESSDQSMARLRWL